MPAAAMVARTAIVVGAGIAGLSCAKTLAQAGLSVRVLDKGRSPGGRIATRRMDAAGLTLSFDHGAQYAKVTDPAFAEALGPAAPWQAAGETARVGVPGMSALARHLAAGLAFVASRTVVSVERSGAGWIVHHNPGDLVRGREAPGEPEADRADLVAIAVPGPQAVPLLPAPLADAVSRAGYAPCWTVLAAWPQPPDAPDTRRAEGEPIAWAAQDSAKPGRDARTSTWVLQAGPDWTRRHLELGPEDAARALLAEWGPARPMPEPIALQAHRWRFAFAETTVREPFLIDRATGIGACGDSFSGSRLQDAWASGRSLAQALLAA